MVGPELESIDSWPHVSTLQPVGFLRVCGPCGIMLDFLFSIMKERTLTESYPSAGWIGPETQKASTLFL